MVVGFGAPAGEDDFLGLGADQRGDLFTGGFDGGAGALTRSMDRGSVRKISGEIGKHGFEDLRVDGCGGVEIEVNAFQGVHRSTVRITRVTLPR